MKMKTKTPRILLTVEIVIIPKITMPATETAIPIIPPAAIIPTAPATLETPTRIRTQMITHPRKDTAPDIKDQTGAAAKCGGPFACQRFCL
ncbi:MAG: hypothetical protein Q4E89_13240 [Eubacteriales bacterium]|nr:hypothetical protein [Eubacteriales bacterium]